MSQGSQYNQLFGIVVGLVGLALVATIAVYFWTQRDQSLTNERRVNAALASAAGDCEGDPQLIRVTKDSMVVHCQGPAGSQWAQWEDGRVRRYGSSAAQPNAATFPVLHPPISRRGGFTSGGTP
ncbi:hypothetical protein ACPCG0_04545 [Propionibacteriaceae bacterium Y1923]